MDQGRHRSGTLHGIGQPGVEAELRRFPHGADEQKEGDDRQRVKLAAEDDDRAVSELVHLPEDDVVLDRVEQEEDGSDTQHEGEVADTIDDEGLDGGGTSRRAIVPEADQEVGGETDTFPAEEQLQEVVGGDEHEHGEGEEREVAHEPRDALVVGHVTHRIDVDQKANEAHDQHHHRRERVDPELPVDLKAANLDPAPKLDLGDGLAHIGKEPYPRTKSRDRHQGTGDDLCAAIADHAAEQAGNQRTHQGAEDEDGVQHRFDLSPSSN